MKEQKKKQLIASLLLISCIISGYMLFAGPGGEGKRLNSLAQADSLIQNKLSEFNINDDQVRISTNRVDSNFIRKTYHIGLPYQFSKTQFHAELNRTLHQYSIKTPAKVTFPEQNIDIHLLINGTVIRTLSLQTDPELVMNRNKVSILITSEELPGKTLIAKLASLGEPIPLVIKIEDPMHANELTKKIGNQYNRIIFWLQNSDGENLMTANPDNAITKLKQLEDILPKAHILQFRQNDQKQQQLMTKTNLTFISAADALLLHEEMGKASFFEELDKLRSQPEHSIAVINGSNQTLDWLKEKLPELKKAGIDLVSPPQTSF